MFKKLFSKKNSSEEDKIVELPLGLRPGGGINISDISLALMRDDLASDLQGGYYNIVKIGQIKLDELIMYKLYLSDSRGNEDWSLNISYNQENQSVEQVSFYGILDQVFPASRDEWEEWIDKKHGHLNAPTLITPTDDEYIRVWNDSDEYIDLITLSEIIVSESQQYTREVEMMLFGRNLPDNTFEEISATVINDKEQNYICLEGGPVLSFDEIEIY